MKVLVCDDMPDRYGEVVEKIRDAGKPNPDVLVVDDPTTALTKLFENVSRCMNDPINYQLGDKSRFDDVDIVIVDNNLAHLHITGARLTAESIAGYIRAFTNAPYIISLNKNPDVDFDLRYMVGDYSTRADLALNTDHLSNPPLWSGDPANATNGFIPWYWPRLEEIANRRRRQIEFVLKHLDDSVFSTLDFDDEAIGFLSAHALGALSPKAESDGANDDGIPIKDVTFRDVFIGKGRSLPVHDEREQLSDAEKAGNTVIREMIAHIVAADMDLWFRRDVVGPQEPLVDVPHLLMRLPFLLGKRAKDLDEWNKCISIDAPPYGVEERLYDHHLAKAKYEHDIWVPNACFRWHHLKADDDLNKLFFAAKEGDWADVVFCEDRSLFLERSPKNGEPPIEFPAEFEGSWERRHVAHIEGIQYAPRSRLAI